MIIRIHNTGDPYKLPTLSRCMPSFPRSLFPFIISSSFPKDRPSPSLPECPGNLCRQILSFSFLLTLKKYTSLLLSFRNVVSRCLPYGQMLPHNDLFLHLIPDLSSTALSFFSSLPPCDSLAPVCLVIRRKGWRREDERLSRRPRHTCAPWRGADRPRDGEKTAGKPGRGRDRVLPSKENVLS